MVCCTLAVPTYFFSVYSESLLLLFDKTVLDFLHFILCLRRIFLISEWLILSTSFRSHIRKPARTRNDHVENPKSKDLGFEDALYQQSFLLYCYQTCAVCDCAFLMPYHQFLFH